MISGGGVDRRDTLKPLESRIFFTPCVYQDDSCLVREPPGVWLISRRLGVWARSDGTGCQFVYAYADGALRGSVSFTKAVWRSSAVALRAMADRFLTSRRIPHLCLFSISVGVRRQRARQRPVTALSGVEHLPPKRRRACACRRTPTPALSSGLNVGQRPLPYQPGPSARDGVCEFMQG